MTTGNTPTTAHGGGVRSGLVWNMGSLAFLAMAGFTLNIAIGRAYGAAQLGVFNISFAFFIVFSQIGSFGIHLSALQSVSELWDHAREQAAASIREAVIACLGMSALATMLWLVALPFVARLYPSESFSIAWLLMAPGLFFFSINKLLLNVVNGANHMRAFAILQALRYLFILLGVGAALFMTWPGYLLTLLLTIAEVLLFPLVAGYVWRILPACAVTAGPAFRHQHLSFGSRAFLSGAVIELNTRVDVLMLGALMSQQAAGVYTIAGLVAEGLAMAVFAVRNVLNPLIGRQIAKGDVAELLLLSRQVVALFTPFMALAGLAVLLLFPWFSGLVFDDKNFDDATAPLLWLVAGLVTSAGLLVFNMLFALANKPGLHTLYMLAILAANVLLNLLLIPRFGIAGAGMAAAGSYLASAALIVLMARKLIGVRLLL